MNDLILGPWTDEEAVKQLRSWTEGIILCNNIIGFGATIAVDNHKTDQNGESKEDVNGDHSKQVKAGNNNNHHIENGEPKVDNEQANNITKEANGITQIKEEIIPVEKKKIEHKKECEVVEAAQA